MPPFRTLPDGPRGTVVRRPRRPAGFDDQPNIAGRFLEGRGSAAECRMSFSTLEGLRPTIENHDESRDSRETRT